MEFISNSSAPQDDESFEFALYDTDAMRLSLSEEAYGPLSRIDAPFAVAVVCGSSRGGKSTLLNFLSHSNAFKTSAGVDACTLGLRALYKESEGILYVDSQGLFDGVVDDIKLIAACIMLADLFIYNTAGTIDLSKLNVLSDGVRLATDMGRLDADHLHSPSLLWIERDYTTSLGVFSDPSEYLEAALSAKVGVSSRVSQANASRSAVKDFFRVRHCVRLPLPSDKLETLQNLGIQHAALVRMEFNEGLRDISNVVRSVEVQENASAKGLVCGIAFTRFAEQVLAAVNDRRLPDGGLYAQLRRSVLAEATAAAATAYLESLQLIESKLPCSEESLTELHAEELLKIQTDAVARSKICGNAFGVIAEMPKDTAVQLQKLRNENESLSTALCAEMEKKLTALLSRSLVAGRFTTSEAAESFAVGTVKSWEAKFVGPASQPALQRAKQFGESLVSALRKEAAMQQKLEEAARDARKAVEAREKLVAEQALLEQQAAEKEATRAAAEVEEKRLHRQKLLEQEKQKLKELQQEEQRLADALAEVKLQSELRLREEQRILQEQEQERARQLQEQREATERRMREERDAARSRQEVAERQRQESVRRAPDGGPLYFHGGGWQGSGMTQQEFHSPWGQQKRKQVEEWRRQGYRWDENGNLQKQPH